MAGGHMLGMLLAAVGIWVSYIPYGVYQESIYSFRTETGEHFTFTLTLLVCQVLAHTITALFTTLAMRESFSTMPLRAAWFPGATFVGAMFCSNMALEYVSYPTQALAKSSKMIPVMLGGLIMGSEKYSLIQYLQVLLVTVGITVFQWKKSGGSKESDFFGLVLLIISLLLDGLTGPRQKVITRNTRCTSFQLMLCCNAWALLLVLAGLLSPYGEGLDGVRFILAHPTLLQHVVLFSLCSAMGSSFIFYTLKAFGPLRLTLITTTRKFFTVFVSVFVFGHFLTPSQWFAVALVLGGVSLELVEKFSESSHSSSTAAPAPTEQTHPKAKKLD